MCRNATLQGPLTLWLHVTRFRSQIYCMCFKYQDLWLECVTLGCTFRVDQIVARLLDSFLEESLAYNSLPNSLKFTFSLCLSFPVFPFLVEFQNQLIILPYPYHASFFKEQEKVGVKPKEALKWILSFPTGRRLNTRREFLRRMSWKLLPMKHCDRAGDASPEPLLRKDFGCSH